MAALLSYVADLLLVTASLGAAAYCMILSRRLMRLGSFDKGIGSAIAVLSAQVDEMKAALGDAKAGSEGAGRQLADLVRQAQDISAELEMMIAACHDFAEAAIEVQTDAGLVRGTGRRSAAQGPGPEDRGEYGVETATDPGIEHGDEDATEVWADAALSGGGSVQAIRAVAESGTAPEGAAETGAETTGAIPMFGSRRAAGRNPEDAVPVFRHRSGTGA